MSTERHWDVVIVGSGFGGSTTALTLAKAGLSVLVLERGKWVERDDSAWDTRAIHVEKKYRGSVPIRVIQERKPELLHPNHTVGGSSVFYGGASFRLRKEDFRRRSLFGEQSGSGFVDWPIDYADLAPYYDDSERMLGVSGVTGVDPTEPPRKTDYFNAPPAYTAPARRVASAATALGLRPFPIPLAINYGGTNGNGDGGGYGRNGANKCTRCLTCDLYPCKIEAKNDISVTVLPHAVRHGAEVRDRVLAQRLLRSGSRITGVECIDLQTNELVTFHCDLAIVSGGAIASPKLLLQSNLGAAGSRNDLVGRYLMRHCSGIVAALFKEQTNPEQLFHKQVAITDFYLKGRNGSGPGGPWGMIQSLNVPPREFIQAEGNFITNVVGQRTYNWNLFLMCIAEDEPQAENRVTLDRAGRDQFGQPLARVTHFYNGDDIARRRALYGEAVQVMRKGGGFAWIRIPVKTFSHAMGTCRFGDDPANSVLDPNCRFWGISNLFVVDASFMPTSGAVNPSLTIAANGLRVGDHIAANWDEITSDGKRTTD
jgi:choline dehydrogenase-like flavoprotein